MPDLLSMVHDLRRPRLLIRAARAGLADYNRCRDLKRVMRVAEAPVPGRALSALVAEEERIEATRQSGDAGYSFLRHIEILIAMMAELRHIARADGV